MQETFFSLFHFFISFHNEFVLWMDGYNSSKIQDFVTSHLELTRLNWPFRCEQSLFSSEDFSFFLKRQMPTLFESKNLKVLPLNHTGTQPPSSPPFQRFRQISNVDSSLLIYVKRYNLQRGDDKKGPLLRGPRIGDSGYLLRYRWGLILP